MTWKKENVRTWRIIGYENRMTSDQSFTENRRKFAEIYSGAATTVYFELELTGNPSQNPLTLAGVELRWVDPETGEDHAQTAELTTHAAGEDSMARLGALIGLAADRYAALGESHEDEKLDPARDLDQIGRELDRLRPETGRLNAPPRLRGNAHEHDRGRLDERTRGPRRR